jgi:hypothetical protein
MPNTVPAKGEAMPDDTSVSDFVEIVSEWSKLSTDDKRDFLDLFRKQRKATRRSALALTGAGIVAALVSGCKPTAPAFADVPALGPTLVLAKFREWKTAWAEAEAFTGDDAVMDRLTAEMVRLETEMCALPNEGVADFAAKLLAVTAYGDFGLDDAAGNGRQLLAEALQLVSPSGRA